MPWLAIPYSDSELKDKLSQMFKVQGIPMLVILSPDGSIITTTGREGVSSRPESFPWTSGDSPTEISIGDGRGGSGGSDRILKQYTGPQVTVPPSEKMQSRMQQHAPNAPTSATSYNNNDNYNNNKNNDNHTAASCSTEEEGLGVAWGSDDGPGSRSYEAKRGLKEARELFARLEGGDPNAPDAPWLWVPTGKPGDPVYDEMQARSMQSRMERMSRKKSSTFRTQEDYYRKQIEDDSIIYTSDNGFYEALKNYADEKFKQKLFENSLNHYIKAADYLLRNNVLKPDFDWMKNQHSVCKSNAAICAIKLKKFREAEKLCSEAITSNPQNFKAYYRRAVSRLSLKEPQMALIDLEMALKLEPSNTDIQKTFEDVVLSVQLSILDPFNTDNLLCSRKVADSFSNIGEFCKSIKILEDLIPKMALVFGENFPLTLSTMHSLAVNYYSKGEFHRALLIHEDCLKKRICVFGDAHKDSIESVIAVSNLKKIRTGKEESLYDRMKTKNLLDLIDRRNLNRAGLKERSELVSLLESHLTPGAERRGVTIKLFQAFRQMALSINRDASFWTIARVSAMLNGNHEIIKPNCRFGTVIPSSTLTFDDQCSLINVLLTKHFDSTNKHPKLNLSYKEAVGEKANLFVSFAYSDNYIDLVDALERFLDTNSKNYPVDSTYFWYDTFVNDQWNASELGFEWWANTFRVMVTDIGHTLCFMSPWNNPTYLTRVWCLLEMRYSPRLTLILSRKEVASFENTIKTNVESVTASLCRIKVEKAISFKPEDKERIFEVIDAMEGGFDGFDNIVMDLLRDWIYTAAKSMTSNVNIDGASSNKELHELSCTASVFVNQGKFNEAKQIFERVLRGYEKLYGSAHKSVYAACLNLGQVLDSLGNYDEAVLLLERAIKGHEIELGPTHENTLKSAFSIGNIFSRQGKHQEARLLLERVLRGYEKTRGAEDRDTINVVNSLAVVYSELGRKGEAIVMLERGLAVSERSLGLDHDTTITFTVNLGVNLYEQGQFDKAEVMLRRALKSKEHSHGMYHVDTLKIVGNIASVLEARGNREEAILWMKRAMEGFERTLGPDHVATLEKVQNVANYLFKQGKTQEAKLMFSRALTGFEKSLGPTHPTTLHTKHSMAMMLGNFCEKKSELEKILEEQEKALGANNAKTLMTAFTLAVSLHKDFIKQDDEAGYYGKASKDAEENLDKAGLLLERVVKGREESFGTDHLETCKALHQLGKVLYDQNKLLDAKMNYERALRGYEKHVGPNHLQTIDAVCDLALVHFDKADLPLAEEMFKRVLKVLGPNHEKAPAIVEKIRLCSSRENYVGDILSRLGPTYKK